MPKKYLGRWSSWPEKLDSKVQKQPRTKKNLQAKFENLDMARRNVAMKSSREILLREEEKGGSNSEFPLAQRAT